MVKIFWIAGIGTAVTLIAVFIAWWYYRGVNASEDPRILPARDYLMRSDRCMQEGKYPEAMMLTDSAAAIITALPCYKDSYEMGVLENNRGSASLGMAIYQPGDSLRKQELLVQAEKHIRMAIAVYEQWLARYRSSSREQLVRESTGCFQKDDPALEGKDLNALIEKRADDLELARVETPRRLSVAWSNLGMIQRHQYQQDSALESYLKALRIWKRNPTAKNNLNTLLGRPMEDESILEQLFPPDRRKPD